MTCAYRVLLIENKTIKLFRSFNGGYIGSDGWALNSGTTKIEVVENGYVFYGYSGSEYFVPKQQGRLNHYTDGVYNKITFQECVEEISVEQAIEFLKSN